MIFLQYKVVHPFVTKICGTNTPCGQVHWLARSFLQTTAKRGKKIPNLKHLRQITTLVIKNILKMRQMHTKLTNKNK